MKTPIACRISDDVALSIKEKANDSSLKVGTWLSKWIESYSFLFGMDSDMLLIMSKLIRNRDILSSLSGEVSKHTLIEKGFDFNSYSWIDQSKGNNMFYVLDICFEIVNSKTVRVCK